MISQKRLGRLSDDTDCDQVVPLAVYLGLKYLPTYNRIFMAPCIEDEWVHFQGSLSSILFICLPSQFGSVMKRKVTLLKKKKKKKNTLYLRRKLLYK